MGMPTSLHPFDEPNLHLHRISPPRPDSLRLLMPQLPAPDQAGTALLCRMVTELMARLSTMERYLDFLPRAWSHTAGQIWQDRIAWPQLLGRSVPLLTTAPVVSTLLLLSKVPPPTPAVPSRRMPWCCVDKITAPKTPLPKNGRSK